MKKTREIVKETKTYEHDFYCDECNEFIGTSQEYEDGWYKDLGEFELKIYIDDWYSIKKCLCHECRRVFIENLKVKLKNIGFKCDREGYLW